MRAARDHLIANRSDYTHALATFTWPDVGPKFSWAHDWFDAFATDNPNPGLVIVQDGGDARTYSFDEVVRASNQVARWLQQQGVTKGDVVLVMLGNQVELWQTVLAIMKLGAVTVPTTPAAGSLELVDRVERAAATFVVCNDADASKVASLEGSCKVLMTSRWEEVGRLDDSRLPHPGTTPAERLLLYFTSGTTTAPKLVEHTQISYPVGHLSTMYWVGLQPGDVHLNVSSPGWAKHAWSSLFAPWLAEATVMVYAYERFDAGRFLQVLADHEVTTLCAPPTVWRMLINADLSTRPAALRELVAAGEPLNPEVIQQVRTAWGLTIRDGFGQTESTAQVGNTPGSELKIGSMGRPLPGMPVVLVDVLSGEPTRAEGEICLDLAEYPVALMTGYQNDPERDAEAKRGGYYHTGDVATIDDDGYITYVGRTDDVFKASDYKISPFELESALIEHPAVAEAAVVPAPDPVRLAVPKAYVSLAPGYDASRDTALDILAFARDRLAPYQRVRRLEFIDLPKTISGKIRRVDLRAREVDRPAASEEFRDDEFPELRTGR
ncbi:AMP-dependent synthetase [Nocardioides sp. Root151]|nr:AMP-dependent synthetase [Nocardioides sp. Root151]